MRMMNTPPPFQSAIRLLVETTNPKILADGLMCTALLGSVRDWTTVSLPLATRTTSSVTVSTPNGCGTDTECAKKPLGAKVLVGFTTWRVDRSSPVPKVIVPAGLGVGVGVGLAVADAAWLAKADADARGVGVCELARPTVGLVGLMADKISPSTMAITMEPMAV